jgi:hypothetical protein
MTGDSTEFSLGLSTELSGIAMSHIDLQHQLEPLTLLDSSKKRSSG